ncbi:hypothetical protein [Nocardia pneumoniae]|uniref:hypothetical protein n=1 Tax=Nocardia pneumoniae TaxID=228601 RepID=UPI0007C8477F|nr:hypothetical protein [Nocardia pneumoniae]
MGVVSKKYVDRVPAAKRAAKFVDKVTETGEDLAVRRTELQRIADLLAQRTADIARIARDKLKSSLDYGLDKEAMEQVFVPKRKLATSVVTKLLSSNAPGASEYLAQVPYAQVVATWGVGSPSVDLAVRPGAVQASGSTDGIFASERSPTATDHRSARSSYGSRTAGSVESSAPGIRTNAHTRCPSPVRSKLRLCARS